jgi:hypothetical protein
MKMKNFDEILTDCLKGKGLRYIRFKVDPTLNAGFEESDSYEGFILHELTSEACGGPMINGIPPMLKVLMPGGSMPGIYDIKEPVITPNKPKAIEVFKKFVIKKLSEQLDNKEITQIKNTDNINDIELYLKQAGLSDTDITNLYKKVLTHAA